MRNIRIVSIVAVVCVASACEAADAVAVKVLKPARRDVTRWLRLPATVEADAEIVLAARVSGLLKGFSVDVGDRVKPGQVIGHLDAPELEQDVKLAEAQLQEADAEYQRAVTQVEREKARGAELDAQESIDKAEVAKAKAAAAGVHNQCERIEKLFANNAATEQERDLQEFACQEKDAAVAAAEKKLDSLRAERDTWQKDVAISESAANAARSKAKVAQSTLERAKVWWSYTEIKIPQIGAHEGAEAVITRRWVANGDLISAGAGKSGSQPMLSLQVVNPVRVIADVPEADAVELETGTLTRLVFPDLKAESAEYKISRTSNSLSSSSRTLHIEIDVPNAKNAIRPGMMAYVQLAAETHKSVFAVPAECVVADHHQAAVFTVEGNKVKKIGIETGLRGARWVEVLKPAISESTLLIKDNGEGLSDGATVEIQQTE